MQTYKWRRPHDYKLGKALLLLRCSLKSKSITRSYQGQLIQVLRKLSGANELEINEGENYRRRLVAREIFLILCLRGL